jgi:hypothetical protein
MPYDDYEIATRPATTDDVFAVVVEVTRQVVPPNGDAGVSELSFDTPVADWLMSDELIGYALACALEPLAVARPVVHDWTRIFGGPRSRRTLGDVCHDLAPHFAMPVIEPINVMGDRSLPAGAFLVVRRILKDVGIDVRELRPSSAVAPYLTQNCDKILARLTVLAPGRLPPAQVVAPAHATCAWGILLSWIAMCAGPTLGLPRRMIGGFALTLIGFVIAAYLLARHVKPADVRMGATRTFRDLCQVLAGEREAWPGFPVVARTS